MGSVIVTKLADFAPSATGFSATI